MNVLLWFKRDLRTHDHPALTLAAGIGPVLPLYIAEPGYWSLPDTSARQWDFTAESLAVLRTDLAAIGAPLIIRTGDALEIIQRFCRDHRITRIISHEETGNLWTYARDRRIGQWARASGVEWTELPQSGVVRRLTARDGWARSRDAFVAGPITDTPRITAMHGIEPGLLPTSRALRIPDDPCPHRQTGGRSIALQTLASFLETRAAPYRSAMSSPLSAERACSRLSPYLASGCVSVREITQATAARQSERPSGGIGPSPRSFQSRLAWRDHFTQKLEDQPSIEIRCLHPATEGLRPLTPDATRLAAWANGETGIPFVDACMRYLSATGWLNFRMRAMVMATASYHLWLDWRATGPILARRFTDYDPGIHWPQVQMQSGTTGINTPRIYNPFKQGKEHDPTGAFTRRWVPELAAVPDPYLQEPWRWPAAHSLLGLRYPEPVVDVTASARFARETIWGVRRSPAFIPAAKAIVTKHASCKDSAQHPSGRRFIRDPLPEPSAQASFDF